MTRPLAAEICPYKKGREMEGGLIGKSILFSQLVPWSASQANGAFLRGAESWKSRSVSSHQRSSHLSHTPHLLRLVWRLVQEPDPDGLWHDPDSLWPGPTLSPMESQAVKQRNKCLGPNSFHMFLDSVGSLLALREELDSVCSLDLLQLHLCCSI